MKEDRLRREHSEELDRLKAKIHNDQIKRLALENDEKVNKLEKQIAKLTQANKRLHVNLGRKI